MKRHPIIGARIVAPVKKLANVAPIISAHHERFDGNGYPNGLKGEEIPLGARLLSVVDAYGAMTDNRLYRNAHTHAEAVVELQRCSGSQFDPKVVEAFLRVLDRGGPKKVQPYVITFGVTTTSPDSATKPISRSQR
jgi:HD-GYP domain-containing protein (c-di-GMP phosphodiesterase class II)